MKLIYVAGLGHSGSTLLEALLANHPNIETCGELEALPNAFKTQNDMQKWCACRTPVAECKFWQGVVRRSQLADHPAPRINLLRGAGGAGPALKAQLPFLFSSVVPGASRWFERPDTARQYATNNLRVLQAYLDELEDQGARPPEFLVDSSKNPYRLCWLSNDERLELHVLHIVRHPCEHARRAIEHHPGVDPWRTAAREGVRWSASHLYTQRVAERGRAVRSYQVVSYEALASNPGAVLDSVLAGLGIHGGPPGEELVTLGRLSHSVAGNAGTRFHSAGIKLFERWRKELPLRYQRTVSSLSALTARTLDYPL